MERRRRNRHASPKPKRQTGYFCDPDNVIPAEHPPTIDEIIAGCGRALMRLGPLSNRELAMILAAIYFIRDLLGLKEITNEVVVWAVNMAGRGLSNRKIIIIQRGNDLITSTSPNGCSSGQAGTKVPTEEDL